MPTSPLPENGKGLLHITSFSCCILLLSQNGVAKLAELENDILGSWPEADIFGFSTAEKPNMGLTVTIAAGITNILLDALFVAVLSGGLAGAAAATVCGQLVGGIVPVFYFARKNSSPLRLTRTDTK